MGAKSRCIAALLVVLLLGVSRSPVSAPREWVQFRLNAANNAVLSGDLETSWTLTTNGGFSSSPALAGHTLYIGNNAGTLYAIDYRTGKTRWTYTANAPLMSNPIVLRDLVIVGEGNQNSHTFTNDAGVKDHLLIGTGENAIIALGRRDGKERWRVTMDGTAMPTPAVINGMLVAHNGSGFIAAIDPDHGTVVYSKDVGSAASMSAILPTDGEHAVSAGAMKNIVIGLNVRDGSTTWTAEFPEAASGLGDCPPAGDGTRVFCDYIMPPDGYEITGAGRPGTEHVYAVDATSGTIAWDVPVATGTVPQWNEAAIPLVDGGRLYVGSSIVPRMHALDLASGKVLWHTDVRGAVKGGAAAKDGVLYFGDYSGYLWALDERTGRIIGDKRYDTSFNVGSPIIAGKTLVIGSNTGTIIAVPLAQILKSRD